ncbi:hypothetical protein JOC74_004406 [Bacillus capparidis]|uniref:Uncharacterized protein n=1 Tax=Bacillus capparidis TaxID=1840411 RepID=A0ABS4D2L7_9BACI|nr:hypothetical protein [Bacillus capparidis]
MLFFWGIFYFRNTKHFYHKKFPQHHLTWYHLINYYLLSKIRIKIYEKRKLSPLLSVYNVKVKIKDVKPIELLYKIVWQ